MNKYFTEKTDGIDDVFAEDFNNAFDSVETDMNARQKTSEKNVADGYAGLDSTGKINKEQIPETTASDVPYTGTESGLSALNVQSALDELASDYEQGKVESDNRYLPMDTITGTVLQTEYAIAANAKNYQVYGNSVQYGTPTPEIPIEIQSVGDLVTSGEYAGKYDVPVTVRGKNLINLDQGLGTVLVKNNNGTYTLTKVSASVRFSGTIDLFIPKETQITLTLEVDKYTGTSSRAVEVRVKFSDNSYAAVNIQSNRFSGSFSKDVVSCVLYQNDSNADGAYTIFKNFQIESGTSATAYEPYRAETKQHIYLDEPLRKVGDYADYIDYEKQKVVRQIEVLDDTGTKTIDESFGTLSIPIEEPLNLAPTPLGAGTNNITTGTAVQPSNVIVDYYQNPTDVINSLKNAIVAMQSQTE